MVDERDAVVRRVGNRVPIHGQLTQSKAVGETLHVRKTEGVCVARDHG